MNVYGAAGSGAYTENNSGVQARSEFIKLKEKGVLGGEKEMGAAKNKRRNDRGREVC